jgi:hypothetical protein
MFLELSSKYCCHISCVNYLVTDDYKQVTINQVTNFFKIEKREKLNPKRNSFK